MSDYIVSARKYRPDSFETLIGQDTIARTLSNSIRRGQLARESSALMPFLREVSTDHLGNVRAAADAQQQLVFLHSLETSHFYRCSRYFDSLDELGFEQSKLVPDVEICKIAN